MSYDLGVGVGVSDSISVTGTATFRDTWEGQWARAMRSMAKLPGEQPPTSYFDFAQVEDAYVHCMQDLWHVKDWLKNDPAVPQSAKDALEPYVDATWELQLVADLANGTKHRKLGTKRTPPRTGDPATRVVAVEFEGDPTVGLAARVVVASGGKSHDARFVARHAEAAWRAFFANHGIRVPNV